MQALPEAGADALVVEQEQQALALDALEAEVYIAGQTLDRVAVEGAVRDLGEARDQLVPQGADLHGVFVDVRAGMSFNAAAMPTMPGDIFGARALAALPGAALDDVRENDALARIEHADALRPVELVAGEGEHVDVLLLHVDVQMPRSLHGVGMEKDASLFANCADLGDGQHGADLVVGVHDGHKAGVRADGALDLLGGDGANLADRQKLDLKAPLFRAFSACAARHDAQTRWK